MGGGQVLGVQVGGGVRVGHGTFPAGSHGSGVRVGCGVQGGRVGSGVQVGGGVCGGRVGSGAKSLAGLAGSIAEGADALVRLRCRRVVWWQGWTSGSRRLP